MINPILFFEQWYDNDKYTFIITFIFFVFIFGFIFGVIVGEYNEMIYLNTMINNTAYGIPTNNILKNDFGLFYIQPYIEYSGYNFSVAP